MYCTIPTIGKFQVPHAITSCRVWLCKPDEGEYYGWIGVALLETEQSYPIPFTFEIKLSEMSAYDSLEEFLKTNFKFIIFKVTKHMSKLPHIRFEKELKVWNELQQEQSK